MVEHIDTVVVGSGQSGCQVVEDLRAARREIHLSVGSVPRIPRRYRGRDIMPICTAKICQSCTGIEGLEGPTGEVGFEVCVETWAKAFGAVSDCAICGVTVINPYSFAEQAVQHYEISESEADDAFDRIENAVIGSSVDTGGWDGDGSLCAYHANQITKDD